MQRSIAQTLLFILLAWLATSPRSDAHQAESSYLRARIQPGLLEVRVTFDVFTLQKVAPMLDANRDNALSKLELADAAPMIRQFIEANVGVELDGKEAALGAGKDPFWPLDAPDPLPASSWHDNGGLIMFPFDLPLTTQPHSVGLIFDAFPVIGDRHRVFAVFEQGAKSRPVILSASANSHRFTVENGAPASGEGAEPADPHEPSTAGQFFWEGVKHILEGYDHIAFLIALLVAATGLRQVVLIVTAFTVAHSVTLILAARGIVQLPSRAVECAIAATILYVAAENLLRNHPRHRWGLTFCFGLIHGFGFANVLAELTLPTDAMVSSLLLFNVGVEAGQLAIVLVLWPILHRLGRVRWGRRLKAGVNVAIALLGLAWLLDRIFALELMPF